jgi:hypothetical protein
MIMTLSSGQMPLKAAKNLGVRVNENDHSSVILNRAVEGLANNSADQEAVLIDEWDVPYLAFTDRPAELVDAREISRVYFNQLKTVDASISFILSLASANSILRLIRWVWPPA